jgi:hypothetical protein
MTETLNERLDRIESDIKSLSDIIKHIKPADINKKQVSKLIGDLSLQIKSIKPGISEDKVKSMLSDFKSGIPKPGISKKDVSDMISNSLSEIKPPERDSNKDIDNAINRKITKEFITGLYRGK